MAMKKNIIYISVLAFALLLSACERVEEIDAPVSGKMEEMKFFASIESGADTKTMIDGNVGDETRYLKWLPEDAIGVYNKSSKKFEKFVNVNTETSASGVFEGENTVQDVYYAVYPYSELHSYADRDKIMTVDLPAVQNYAENTFGNGANPMVAHAESGEELNFQNLCGVLVINLTGSVTVKSMSVTLLDETGNLAPVSGKHTVLMDYIEEPSLKSTEESTRTVTLDCGDGVALNAAEPTPFHIVVPAGTYSGVTLNVVTADGQMMVKQGKNQLKIRRRRVTSAGALGWEAVVSVDLSERGTSNCYIVSEPGAYSFDATVIGNGDFGLIPYAGFHTDNVNISPSAVELLWEDRSGVVQSVFCKDGRIGFYSSGVEGNALLAAKDASGTIIWSWHIWVTDKPAEQIYENSLGTFIVIDRNLGATRSDRGTGDEWKNSVGTYYQWGRKDPLKYPHYEVTRNSVSLVEAITAPSTFFYQSSVWLKEENHSLWSPEYKTIYDPCPVGFKVPSKNIWQGFSVSENNDKGLYFKYDESGNTSWYPSSSWIDTGGSLISHDYESYVWAAEYKANLHFSQNSLELTGTYQPSNGFNIRCVKDEEYVDISLPQVEISGFGDVTTTTAKVVVKVKSAGVSEVTERGIIWGTTEDLSGGTKIVSEVAADEYVIELTGLQKSTRYYVKPYAINNRGESQSADVKYFTTLSTDDEVFLSQNGTANCYIVPPVPSGVYSFDCTVQGNSEDTVGAVASLEVLWEVDGCSATAQQGTVISSVELRNGVLGIIMLPSVAKEGNALIAAKDNEGTILWSWHIWVTDTPVEQTYVNDSGTFVVLDRNIGATRADRGEGDEWLDSRGFAYFWGRKDPFWYGSYTEANGFMTLEQSISNPAMRHRTGSWGSNSTSWLGENQHISTLWTYNNKSIYDPCPNGYKVAVNDIWTGFTTIGTSSENSVDLNVTGEFNNGWEFYIDNTNTAVAWYPANYWMVWHSGYDAYTTKGAAWAANYSAGSNKYCLSYDSGTVNPNSQQSDGHGLPVRCMKE